MSKNWKKSLAIVFSVIGVVFVIMRYIARKQNEHDKYKNNPAEQNPLYKKKVVFIENENEPVNADGKCGHLEAVGESNYIPTFYEKYIKRGLDIILSFAGMVVLAPVYAVTAIAIKVDSPGAVVFKQKRISQQNGWFTLPKFRSMSQSSDVPTHMLKNNQQNSITSVGKVIRKLSIDELPQFWSIFKGDMSVIGPRPALWNQDYLTAERDKYGANDIKPGLTGLAQISGRDELEIPEKAKLDGFYAQKLKNHKFGGMLGLFTDIEIFVKSVLVTLGSKGVVEGGTGQIAKELEKAGEL